MRFRLLLAMVVLTTLFGCTAAPAGETRESRASGAAEPAGDPGGGAQEAPVPSPPLPGPEEFPPPPPSPDPEDEQRTNQALSAAADSAEQAQAGSDDCESAHNQLLAMYTTVERELGGTMHRPVRQDFLEVCREMPPAARRCVVPTYAMEHGDDCATALDALPDDLKQRFAIVVNGPEAN